MDVNEHDRLFNNSLGLDTNWSKGTTLSLLFYIFSQMLFKGSMLYKNYTIDIYSIRNRNKCVFQYLEKSILYFTSLIIHKRQYLESIGFQKMLLTVKSNSCKSDL